MKIAIFHNFLDNIGGAEILALTMAKGLNADVYTTNVNFEKIRQMGFNLKNVKSIGSVPSEGPLRYKKVLMLFKGLNLGKKYDFYIISGEWSISAALNNKPNLLYSNHLIKEAWDYSGMIRKQYPRGIWRIKFDLWVTYYRFLTRKYFKHIEKIVSDSNNIRSKIRKYLNRESYVIYPCIQAKEFKHKKNGEFWLSVNRILGQKRIEIQMGAFAKLPNEKIIMVGSHEESKQILEYKKYIESIRPTNVKIMGEVNKKKLIDLYSKCKGFITTAKDEDFGLTAIEAMASGKPVIAPNEGGYKETIINEKTGILINEINEDKLVEAIKIMGKNPGKYRKACVTQARKFDTAIFINKIKEVIDKDIRK